MRRPWDAPQSTGAKGQHHPTHRQHGTQQLIPYHEEPNRRHLSLLQYCVVLVRRFRQQARSPSNRACLGGYLVAAGAGPPEMAEVHHLCTRAGRHCYVALQVLCLILPSFAESGDWLAWASPGLTRLALQWFCARDLCLLSRVCRHLVVFPSRVCCLWLLGNWRRDGFVTFVSAPATGHVCVALSAHFAIHW